MRKMKGIVLRAQLEQGSKYSASLRGEDRERPAMNIKYSPRIPSLSSQRVWEQILDLETNTVFWMDDLILLKVAEFMSLSSHGYLCL